MQNIKPLKRFGQNYLTDENIINKIVSEFNPEPEDQILEIGPGKGSLTAMLLQRVDKISAIEIDRRVILELRKKFKNLKLVEKDFLEINLSEFYRNKKLRIIGNIPYNLTSPILFKLMQENNVTNDCVLMVQLEVAKRMIAKQGSKDYGILTVLLSYFSDTKLCFKISPNVFYPKPRVHSALVHIFFKELSEEKEYQKTFIKIVKAAFGNRRKTLKNSFGNSVFKDVNFASSGIDLSKRAEQLSIDEFKV
ncbi:MAG: 16S rRNA (adenine(1518)-N(6)/adenine(1519)-N(6))-dimethyltransferase RsmA, partial [Nitrososphaeraceae archaeon]|nr:16S rRNA (adenine(1518)-N(6)/adenine(1519)-N(6))-dimethyltransferase RsmA [Nitrososphaeraceae archaeon]